MAELVFPLAAVALTFLLLIPGLTVVARLALVHRRRRAHAWARFGSAGTFAWLVAPTLLPILWLASSALHHSEASAEVCLVPHGYGVQCLDALLLLGLTVVGLSVGVGLRAWRTHPRLAVSLLAPDDARVLRVRALTQADPHLRHLDVGVANHAAEPVFTIGWLRPRAIVDACFVEAADDAMLHASLLHEQAHAAGRDSLRCFVVRLCLGVNPLGRWLAPEFARWRGAREAECDGEAVHHGGEALALAEGILKAARFRCAGTAVLGVAALCGHDAVALKLRVELLLQGPVRPHRSWGHRCLAAAALAAIVLPHVFGSGVLEVFHSEIERAAGWLQ